MVLGVLVLGVLVLGAVVAPVLSGPQRASAADSVSDNFNRADGNLGANWTDMTDGGLAISSQVVVGTNGAYSGDIRTGETYASDQSSQIEVTSTQLSGGQWIGAGVRAQNGGQSLYLGLYFWNNGNPELMLFKRISGNWTQLGASSFQGALGAGTQLNLSVTGSTLSFSQNGVVRITASDTSLTGGAPAVMAFGGPQGDNWVGVGTNSSAPTFSVGGTISGLSGTVVLENNGGNDLSTSANGGFAFSTQLAQGAAYNVTVKTNPSGQTCTVTNPSGTVAAANVTNVSVTCVTQTAPTFSVGGTISGLSGTVVLENNGGNDLSTSANGGFAFSTQLAQGAAYNVTVKTNPSGQTCTVTNPSGTVATANVTNVSVTCVTQTAAGSVSDNFNRANGSLGANWTDMTDGGLAISSQVVVGTNSAYSGDIRTGETYASDQSSQIEVTSTQLSGGQWIGAGVRAQNGGQSLYLGLYFWNNGNPELMLFKRISGNWTQLGASSFQGALGAGTQLNLTVTGSTLSFSQNGVVRITASDTSLTGGAPAVMAFGGPQGDNWVGVGTNSSAPTFSVGGTISGLSGTVVLENNGGNDLSTSANGGFAFSTQLAQGAAYNVTVKTNPSGQTCTVTNPSGTVAAANVTNVSVTCVTQTAPTFSVGGTISGLSGTVVLENNGGNDLSTSANGGFAFSTQLAQGAAYNVTVKTNPSGQTCTVTNPSGTVAAADVTNVSVTCVTQTAAGSVSDNFNRANGNLGANWTDMTDGGLAISSQVVVGTNGAYSGDIRTGETYASDQSSQIEVTSTQLSGGQWIGAGVRAQNGGQSLYLGLYFWNNGNPELMLFKRISGNWTQLGASSFQGALGAGTQLNLSVTGSTLSFSQNGVVRITASDTSLTGGAPAVMAFGGPQGDNWVGVGTNSSAPTFSVGGTISGLSGTVVLENNGGNDLSTSANGGFAFSTQLAQGAAYNVTVKTNPSGQTCTVTNPSGTVAAANVTNVSVACANLVAGFSPQYVSTDANNVETFSFTSANDGDGTQTLRVLPPTHPVAGVAHKFLYVLPVEPGLGNTFGDGIDTMLALDAQDQYNLTIIEPTFSIEPWYANNPNDANLQYETFMTTELEPWVQANLSTTGTEQNWLIGFSKSGIGAQDLILKHPDLFQLAASWDFPADMSSYAQFGSSSANNYGTDANFQANYRLTAAFLDAHKSPFLTNNRIWLGGGEDFPSDVSDYDALLTSEGIVHTVSPSQQIAHRWDSGWVPQALAALEQDSTQQH